MASGVNTQLIFKTFQTGFPLLLFLFLYWNQILAIKKKEKKNTLLGIKT